jgi:geranylgeranylglycerol-phosphate geranylgeranyltransferase
MNGLTAFLKLTRIEHSVLLIFAVIAAELLVGGLPVPTIFVLSLASPALVSMGAFAINDYFDVETDRANRRMDRPIVAGAISKRSAHTIAVFCLVVGAALSLLINAEVFVVAVIFALLAYVYSYKLKDTLLWGNAYVALTMVIPFIYGDLVVSNAVTIDIILISMMIFLVGLAREIHGMIRDRIGDSRVRQTKSLVRYIGARNSAAIALVLYAEGVLVSLYLFWYMAPFRMNLVYIVPVAIADIIFLYIAAGHHAKDDRKFFDRARGLSLVAMGLALLAFLLSAVSYFAV